MEKIEGALVVADDVRDKPNEIPDTCWIKQGHIYQIEKLLYNPITDQFSFELTAPKLPPPFRGFTTNRFYFL